MNIVIIKGNLCRDLELRYTANNSAVANTSIALNHTYKKADGTKHETVTFVDLEVWGVTAETMAKYLGKGRSVLVHGELKQDIWDDKQTGKKQSRLKVKVVSFEFCDSKRDDTPQPDGYKSQRHESHAPAATGPHKPLDDETIPF